VWSLFLFQHRPIFLFVEVDVDVALEGAAFPFPLSEGVL